MTLTVPPSTVDRQRRATTPAQSSWVSANAGSGKTYVLARRIVRLMLAGAQPSSILALTFTKTAAAEMAMRVQGLLGEWALMSDKDLRAELQALEGRAPDSADLQVARRLFAQALETPGGLKIQTIHAFAERVLHQFPIEAGLPMRFDVLEDNASAAILKSAREAIFMRAELGEDAALSEAYEVLTRTTSDYALDDIISQALKQAPLLRDILKVKDQAKIYMARHLDVTLPTSGTSIIAEIFNQSIVSDTQLRDFAPLLAEGGTNDKKLARRLIELDVNAQNLGDYLDLFLTKDGTIPKRSKISKSVTKDYPEIAQVFADEAERLAALTAKLIRTQIYEKSTALLDVMAAIFERYHWLKRARSALDFDDLIFHLKSLLANSETAAWVHYKLDAGINHILVDEAQDTNPDQWEIIASLAQEFFAGDSANPVNRTLFAVGDEKQSIYSFQGARPEIFDFYRRHYARASQQAGKEWDPINLILSFRSTEEILLAVDHVFDTAPALKGLTASGDKPTHEAARKLAPGLVEVWPLEESDPFETPQEWPLRPPQTSQQDATQKLAQRIARKIKHWLDQGEINRATGKPIRAGDILILLQSRGPLFYAIIRALKTHNVPLAGADRLALGSHIAVQDLLVLGQALLSPNDDLALATLLRSPLIGLSEDQLFSICYQRPGSILKAMEATADADPEVGAALEQINRWRRVLDFDRPFEFYSHILATERGRKSFFARLGYEADEILAEFLNLTLAFERAGPATLQGFIHHMNASETIIKREQSEEENAARVMTVHGAKGLEANIVFIADAHRKPDGSQLGNLFQPGEQTAGNSSPQDGLIWLAGQKEYVPELAQTIDQARARQAEEYNRLLYVAMTRAKDQLYICGLKPGKKSAPKDCWHDMVWAGLAPHSQSIVRDDDQQLLRFTLERPPLEKTPDQQAPEIATDADSAERPDWLDQLAPPAKSLPDHISPSRLDDPIEIFAKRKGEPAPELAREQGIAVHAMLQYLPKLAAENRAKAATLFLAQHLPSLSPNAHQRLIDRVTEILTNDHLAHIFGKNSLAEISLTGNAIRQSQTGPKPIVISGQIDRLIVEESRVLIVDFKSGAQPQSAHDVSKSYYIQLGLYALLVGAIYPHRVIQTALLWTSTGTLMEIPTDLTQTAISDFTLV